LNLFIDATNYNDDYKITVNIGKHFCRMVLNYLGLNRPDLGFNSTPSPNNEDQLSKKSQIRSGHFLPHSRNLLELS